MNASVSAPGSSGACRGQLRQELPARLLQLADVSPGIGAQVRAQRGRRADPAEQRAHRAVPQQVHVIDAVRAGRHPGDQARDLQVRVDPALPARADVLRDQVRRARRAPPGPSPGPARRATRDSGHRTMRASSPGYATIALTRCPLEPGTGSFRHSHCPSSEGTFHVDTPENTPISRLSRPGARYPDCSWSVSPGRSPNPAYPFLGTGLSTVSAVRRGCRTQGLGIVLPR